jgi:hypothetical protein
VWISGFFEAAGRIEKLALHYIYICHPPLYLINVGDYLAVRGIFWSVFFGWQGRERDVHRFHSVHPALTERDATNLHRSLADQQGSASLRSRRRRSLLSWSNENVFMIAFSPAGSVHQEVKIQRLEPQSLTQETSFWSERNQRRSLNPFTPI